MVNLVTNALRYTPADGKVMLSLTKGTDAVFVSVEDTGSGIASDSMERVFEPFFRADPARSPADGSAGLGLAIARGLIDAQGGRIWAEHPVAGGTRICFVLPACTDRDPGAPTPRHLNRAHGRDVPATHEAVARAGETGHQVAHSTSYQDLEAVHRRVERLTVRPHCPRSGFSVSLYGLVSSYPLSVVEYRIGQAAELLGVSPDTMRRWVDAGRIKATVGAGGRRYVEGADLAGSPSRSPATIRPAQPRRQSARNRFLGIVTRVVKDKVAAQVEIQAGPHRFVALITREAADELELAPGVVADAVVKATNVGVEIPAQI